MKDQPEKLDLRSHDITEDKKAGMRRVERWISLACRERMSPGSAAGKTTDYYLPRSGFRQNPAAVRLENSAEIRSFVAAFAF